MGILSRIKERFKRKKEEPVVEVPTGLVKPEVSLEPVTIENVKVKMELVLTQLDSLRIQYETLNERIKNIERLVTEIRAYCK